METTTKFPVNPGNVVEVTCSNSDAVNKGSNQVTCTIGTDFTFSEEPSCSIPGLQAYNYIQRFGAILYYLIANIISVLGLLAIS